MIPPGFKNGDGLLVVIDFSWWLNLAVRVGGVEGMLSIVVGKFCDLLRGECPSHLAVAVDSVGPTWRHELYSEYKAGRDPKPPGFTELSTQALQIVRLHGVPILYAEGWEADDVMAAAVHRARAARLRVAILSVDKDLGQLVGADCVLWDGKDDVRGPAEIAANPKHPVAPELLVDLLAITGDAGDNVPGVEGLGPVAAGELLTIYGSLERALTVNLTPPTDEEYQALVRARDKARRSGARDTAEKENLVEDAQVRRRLGKNLSKLHAGREQLLLSRRLVQLDADAPIRFDLGELAVGGYEVEALKRLYLQLGFHRLAAELRPCPKASWSPPPSPRTTGPVAGEEI